MARWIDASPAQRHFQYNRPAAKAALARKDHDLMRGDIAKRGEQLKARIAACSHPATKARLERDLERLRADYRKVAETEARDRWIAFGGPAPDFIVEEFRAAGQSIPSYMTKA